MGHPASTSVNGGQLPTGVALGIFKKKKSKVSETERMKRPREVRKLEWKYVNLDISLEDHVPQQGQMPNLPVPLRSSMVDFL